MSDLKSVSPQSAEEFIRMLLWDDFPECCGSPVVGAEYMGQQEMVCCGNPEPALLSDAQIVASLRERFQEVTPCSTCGGVGMVSTVEYADSMSGFLSGMPCPDCTPPTPSNGSSMDAPGIGGSAGVAKPWQYVVGPIMQLVTAYARAYHAWESDSDEVGDNALFVAHEKARKAVHEAICKAVIPADATDTKGGV